MRCWPTWASRRRPIWRALGVSVRSVYGWRRTGRAPRAALLALFFWSRWGQSLVDAEAVNAARVARGWAQALERENQALRARVQRLERLGDFGSANAPSARPALNRVSGAF